MLTSEQRSALQVGQEVGVDERYHAAIRTVTKRTPTQITLSDGTRWTVKRGNRIGASTWSYGSLWDAAECRENIRRKNHEKEALQAAKRLTDYPWRNFTREQIERVEAFVKAVSEEVIPPHD